MTMTLSGDGSITGLVALPNATVTERMTWLLLLILCRTVCSSATASSTVT
jgi:hypothetical protein